MKYLINIAWVSISCQQHILSDTFYKLFLSFLPLFRITSNDECGICYLKLQEILDNL